MINSVKLSKEVTEKVEVMRKSYEKRGITRKKWEAIVNKVLLDIPEIVWQREVEEHTPEDYFIKASFEDPALRDELLKFIAKKKRTTKPRRQRTVKESNENQTVT